MVSTSRSVVTPTQPTRHLDGSCVHNIHRCTFLDYLKHWFFTQNSLHSSFHGRWEHNLCLLTTCHFVHGNISENSCLPSYTLSTYRLLHVPLKSGYQSTHWHGTMSQKIMGLWVNWSKPLMSVIQNANTTLKKKSHGINQSTTWLRDDAAAASTNFCR